MSRTVKGNLMTLKDEKGELTIETEIKEGTALMKLSGGVTMGLEADFIDELNALLSAGLHVVINCQGLTFFPPSVSVKLVKAYLQAAAPMELRVEMCGVPERIYEELLRADVGYIISDVRREV